MKHLLSFLFLSVFAVAAFADESINNSVTGLHITSASTDRVGFHGVTPVAQRSGADGTALTDSTGGAVSNATLAATSGISTLAIPIQLASMTTSAADLVTAFVPGYRFKILAVDFYTTTVGAGTSASQAINLEIGTTNLTGGVVTVTQASTDTLGEATAGTAVTAANTGTASDSISVEVAASGTVFSAGAGVLLIRIQNMDVQDNFAKTAELVNELRATLVTKGLHAGS